MFSRVVSSGLSAPISRRAPPTLTQVLTKLNITHPTSLGDSAVLPAIQEGEGEIEGEGGRSVGKELATSSTRPLASELDSHPSGFRKYDDNVREEFLMISRAAIEVIFH
jgi:hypothetical protein